MLAFGYLTPASPTGTAGGCCKPHSASGRGSAVVLVTRSGDGERAYEWGRPERTGPIVVAGVSPREKLPLHAAQDLCDDDLSNHRDRVDQRVTESHARVGVGAAVREGEDCGLRLRAAQ